VPIKNAQASDIEICISNNNSSDNTRQTINAWKAMLNLKVVTQSVNIGGTLNSIEVTKQATGRWIQFIGDDDIFYPDHFNELVNILKLADAETWFLVGIADKTGCESLLGDLLNGSYTSNSFRTEVLRTGLYRYGFIGMHIIPCSWMSTFQTLTFSSLEGWPHLALFSRHLLSAGSVAVYRNAVIEQAAGPGALFWKANEWAQVNLRKISLLAALKRENVSHRFFLSLVILRELYAPDTMKNLVLWKVLEAADFYRNAIREYFRLYRSLGVASVFGTLHCLFFLLIFCTPSHFLRFLLYLLGRRKTISEYEHRKAVMAAFNGMDRGL
jgi:glycosyltransferase involved in cell wall biosynthesis